MPNTWLVLDATYLCHRAFHAMDGLSYDDVPTAVVFGFLKDLQRLQDLHGTNLVAFCFDLGISNRRDIYTGYKENRRKRHKQYTENERQSYDSLQSQITKLRLEYLPGMGYQNIYGQDGYEADDIIAQFRTTISKKSHAIMVSADKDLYQLLGPKISMWNIRKNQMVTADSFRDEWGVEPAQWVDVKAIAGCATDDIPGIDGVGEKTAAKYLKGQLNPSSLAFKRITEGNDIWKRNVRLVELPLPGLARLKLRRDKVTRRKFNRVCRKLGIRSLS